MKSEITGAKVILAKLLAQEDINVEMSNTTTASFDLKSRTLTIPALKDNITNPVMALFIGHEVGHALWTPTKDWFDTLFDSSRKVRKSVLNVVEDARIENKIKQKYPGLRYDFIQGYTELFNKDFFGVKDRDLDSLNFVDRVNLHTKLGAHYGISFSPEENVILQKVLRAETFQDVIDVSVEIQELVINQHKEKIKFDQLEYGEGEQNLDLLEESFYSLDSSSFEDEKSEESDEESSYVRGGGNGRLNDIDESEETPEEFLESETMDNFNRKIVSIFDDSTLPIRYIDIPKINANNFIVDYKEIISNIQGTGPKRFTSSREYSMENTTRSNFLDFRKTSLPVVSYLVKEFELKKNADQVKKAKVTNTGDLNPNKLFSYKYSDDIFKKNTVVPNGKSHGLVMFLDWSGSMSKYLKDTIEQCLNLVLFCKKSNIPFEVYAFTCYYKKNIGFVHKKENEVFLSNSEFSLMNLFSSRMSANEFSFMANFLLQKDVQYKSYWLNLGGTPLDHSIIVAMDIIPKFRKKYKLQEVHSIFLTDGDSNNLCFLSKYVNPINNSVVNERLSDAVPCSLERRFLRDLETKSIHKIEDYTSTEYLLNILRKKTGSKAICFRIVRDFREAKSLLDGNLFSLEEKFKKDKSLSVKTKAFDKLMIIKSSSLKISNSQMNFDSTATKSKMLNAFKSFKTGKIKNRMILSEFIKEIS